jgi:hypothetical protein
MLKSLLSFKLEAYTTSTSTYSTYSSSTSSSSSVHDLAVLLQQMYVSIIAQYCSLNEWDKAGKLLAEAFQSIPAALHKPMWRLRMMLMSKQGKDIESEIKLKYYMTTL